MIVVPRSRWTNEEAVRRDARLLADWVARSKVPTCQESSNTYTHIMKRTTRSPGWRELFPTPPASTKPTAAATIITNGNLKGEASLGKSAAVPIAPGDPTDTVSNTTVPVTASVGVPMRESAAAGLQGASHSSTPCKAVKTASTWRAVPTGDTSVTASGGGGGGGVDVAPVPDQPSTSQKGDR